MITAGIDVGLEYTKIVILRDGAVVSKGIDRSGGLMRKAAIEKTWRETLQKAGLSQSVIDLTVATGQGKTDVPFADRQITEAVADAKAARYVLPDAITVADCGADQTRVVRLGKGDDIEEVVLNQKCMAGLGLLMNRTARRLEMTLDALSGLDGSATDGLAVNDGCPVFAEMDILELMNQNVPKEQIAHAVIRTAAVRMNSILNDKFTPARDKTVLFGGITKNSALVKALRDRSGIEFVIPENAEYGCALGAALVGAARG